MKEAFLEKNPSQGILSLITYIGQLVDEYYEAGYTLTVRQIFYQLVSRDLIPNEERMYKKIVRAVCDGRLMGLIDWKAVEDRTRYIRSLSSWEDPQEILEDTIGNYRIDKWQEQSFRLEVWVEKDALVGVVGNICNRHQVSFLSCRGYVSQSELWKASKRIIQYVHDERRVIILHLGDHDPSGIDMTRDIRDRLKLLTYDTNFGVQRIALNMNQIQKYKPPPNPTKLTDTRAREYINNYGHDCWELDSLEPKVIEELIEKHILDNRDDDLWKEAREKEKHDIYILQEIVDGLD